MGKVERTETKVEERSKPDILSTAKKYIVAVYEIIQKKKEDVSFLQTSLAPSFASFIHNFFLDFVSVDILFLSYAECRKTNSLWWRGEQSKWNERMEARLRREEKTANDFFRYFHSIKSSANCNSLIRCKSKICEEMNGNTHKKKDTIDRNVIDDDGKKMMEKTSSLATKEWRKIRMSNQMKCQRKRATVTLIVFDGDVIRRRRGCRRRRQCLCYQWHSFMRTYSDSLTFSFAISANISLLEMSLKQLHFIHSFRL